MKLSLFLMVFSVHRRSVLRVSLASILLAACVLKGHQLIKGEYPQADSEWTRLGFIALINWEFCLAVTWLWRPNSHSVHVTVLLTFLAFGMWSFGSAAAGEESCQCLGAISLNPWLVGTFDLAALAALCKWRPAGNSATRSCHGWRVLSLRSVPLVALAVAGVGGNIAIHSLRAGELDLEGNVHGAVSTVRFAPLAWLGRPLPLMSHIEGGDPLKIGRWTVLLVQRNCRHCEIAVADFCAARANPSRGPHCTVLVIPRNQHEEDWAPCGACLNLRLASGFRWLTRLPVRIELADGVVPDVQYPS